MPRDGSGIYHLPAGNPVTSNTLIESAWANSTLDDIANALTGSLPRNGTAGMSAALNFGNFKGINLAPGTAGTDAVNLTQLNGAIGLANTKVLNQSFATGVSGPNGNAVVERVLMYNPTTGLYQWVTFGSYVNFDISAQGAGGRDQAGNFNATWVHAFWIYGASATPQKSIIFSLSKTAPTLPANYTDYAYAFPARVGATNNAFFPQYGHDNVGGYRIGDNPTIFGGPTTGSVQFMGAWNSYVPPNARAVYIHGNEQALSDGAGSLDMSTNLYWTGDSQPSLTWPFRITGTLGGTLQYIPISGWLVAKDPSLSLLPGLTAGLTAGANTAATLWVSQYVFNGNGAV